MSKETTPMQELIEEAERTLYGSQLRWFRNKANQLLEKERYMVVDAFDNGAQEQDDWYSDPHGGTKTAEQYYNEKYGDK